LPAVSWQPSLPFVWSLAIPNLQEGAGFQHALGATMSDRTIRVVVPEPHYVLLDATREDLPEVILVNDSLLDFAEREIFPWHLRVTLGARELAENGMPSPDESKLLFTLGDEIEDVVLGGRTKHTAQNALFLARSTWNATRELRFQVHDPEITHAALQELLASKKWPRPWDYDIKHDSEWAAGAALLQLIATATPRGA
jgi:hypothetical protein